LNLSCSFGILASHDKDSSHGATHFRTDLAFPITSWTRHPLNAERNVPFLSPEGEGCQTMLTISHQYETFTPQLRQRLQATVMGLGLVRLLHDARRMEEARTVLSSLEVAGLCHHSDHPEPAFV
jgi:hypothetical protein